MSAKRIIKVLSAYSNKAFDIERMVVYAFVKKENIVYNKSKVLSEYLLGLNDNLRKNTIDFFDNANIDLSIDLLVELFEQIIPEDKKKEKGIVYTPSEIKEYIVSQTFTGNTAPTVIDPSCGCGAFLVTAAQYIHSQYDMSYSKIISQKIYGIDIDKDAIKKAKILLALLACANQEYEEISFNFVCSNALDPKTIRKVKKWQSKGFDCVIGNPPYVRFRNMEDSSRALLTNWFTANTGNVDLYMPFFEVGMTLLKKDGVLSYITPNSYIQAVNGRKLREYLTKLNHMITIVDFRDAQMFKNVTSYTCITTINSNLRDKIISYARINEQQTLNNHSYSEYETSTFPNGNPWRMRALDVDSIIEKLETSGNPLSNWKIRNGLATLKNDIYFFTPSKFDSKYYYRVYDGIEYPIERDVCIKVAKPNIIKTEEDLIDKIEIAIFPYVLKNNTFEVINEEELKEKFPCTYKFFVKYKAILNQRDKGKANYPTWYAYGRTQGMNNFGKKLLIPYISDKPTAVLSLEEKMLFYCGYALISDDEKELMVLKRFLESDAFWYYIYHTSKPYSKGYMSLAKNYLINFTIPSITDKEKQYLLSTGPSVKEINEWIWKKYGVEKDKIYTLVDKPNS